MLNQETMDYLIRFLKKKLNNEDAQHAIDILKRTPEVYRTAHWIGQGVEKHYAEHPNDRHDVNAMDHFILEWRFTIQSARPKGEQAKNAFQRVLEEGQRGSDRVFDS